MTNNQLPFFSPLKRNPNEIKGGEKVKFFKGLFLEFFWPVLKISKTQRRTPHPFGTFEQAHVEPQIFDLLCFSVQSCIHEVSMHVGPEKFRSNEMFQSQIVQLVICDELIVVVHGGDFALLHLVSNVVQEGTPSSKINDNLIFIIPSFQWKKNWKFYFNTSKCFNFLCFCMIKNLQVNNYSWIW